MNLLHGSGQGTVRVSAATCFPTDEQWGCRARDAYKGKTAFKPEISFFHAIHLIHRPREHLRDDDTGRHHAIFPVRIGLASDCIFKKKLILMKS